VDFGEQSSSDFDPRFKQRNNEHDSDTSRNPEKLQHQVAALLLLESHVNDSDFRQLRAKIGKM
jgi:hypothetical protein